MKFFSRIGFIVANLYTIYSYDLHYTKFTRLNFVEIISTNVKIYYFFLGHHKTKKTLSSFYFRAFKKKIFTFF